jgi:hypothetical protein
MATLPANLASCRLHIERRGGLAGLKAQFEAEVRDLSAAQRRALEHLLAAPPPPAPAAHGADRFTYSLRLHCVDGSTHQLDLSEDALPEVLADLPQVDLP